MSTKTFKVGEEGKYPKIKFIAKEIEVQIIGYDWDGEIAVGYTFSYDSINEMEFYLLETNDYRVSQMLDWVKTTKECKAWNKKYNSKLDPFTTFTFNLR